MNYYILILNIILNLKMVIIYLDLVYRKKLIIIIINIIIINTNYDVVVFWLGGRKNFAFNEIWTGTPFFLVG